MTLITYIICDCCGEKCGIDVLGKLKMIPCKCDKGKCPGGE